MERVKLLLRVLYSDVDPRTSVPDENGNQSVGGRTRRGGYRGTLSQCKNRNTRFTSSVLKVEDKVSLSSPVRLRTDQVGSTGSGVVCETLVPVTWRRIRVGPIVEGEDRRVCGVVYGPSVGPVGVRRGGTRHR